MKEMKNVCPKCNRVYTAYPALSRIDNRTPICPECGMREAMQSIEIDEEHQDKIINMVGYDVNHTKIED